jgi:hypothetical protein
MPVERFRTFEEAKEALWNFKPDATYFKQLAELWNTANRLCPISYPKGVFRYKSIDEANKQRKQWELEHAKILLKKRGSN